VRLFWNSVQFATGVSAFAFLLGTTLAWMNERTNTPFKGLFYALSLIPLVIPGSSSPLPGSSSAVRRSESSISP
jgi:iron(III) transport system permease protein